jgi:predicted ArsR family transcriptional regulator
MASPTSESVPQPETALSTSPRSKSNKPKKDQLLALVTKPGGTRISVLSERLGWQAHTVRDALSGLRKQGHQILATKAPKTGEAVYQLVKPTEPTAPTEPMEPVEQATVTSPEGDAA